MISEIGELNATELIDGLRRQLAKRRTVKIWPVLDGEILVEIYAFDGGRKLCEVSDRGFHATLAKAIELADEDAP